MRPFIDVGRNFSGITYFCRPPSEAKIYVAVLTKTDGMTPQ
jgi:hypothetical protein